MGKASIEIDRISFELGMINCFVEMVACGVKRLALSPPISPQDHERIKHASDDIVKGFGIQSYLEKSLPVTDLQSEEFTKGKWVILYYEDDDVLNAYLALKEKKQRLENSGQYDRDAQREISREFMRLLSYPEDKIEEKLSQDTPSSPYMLVES
jgi:hypothetical protein